ncbi:MAG: hotdog fold thioesterase [Chitinophagales bacterium]|nr:hotdog fold thioesterase [Chitinophagales bacterium]
MKSIWKTEPNLKVLNGWRGKGASDTMGIEMIDAGLDFLKAKMPVDERTRQPFGILHGGASCVLAETLGSVAGSLCVEYGKQIVVGLEINANHIRPAKEGWVYGTVKPLHLGNTTQVWEIKITNEEDKLVCISRLTLAVKDMPNKA